METSMKNGQLAWEKVALSGNRTTDLSVFKNWEVLGSNPTWEFDPIILYHNATGSLLKNTIFLIWKWDYVENCCEWLTQPLKKIGSEADFWLCPWHYSNLVTNVAFSFARKALHRFLAASFASNCAPTRARPNATGAMYIAMLVFRLTLWHP